MTSFKLQDLEKNVDEALWLEAEDLHITGAVRDLTEVERHLWTAKVQEEGSAEVELQITPGKLKSWSCECARFQQDGVCRHVVGALISLRSLLAHRRREREAKKEAQEARQAEKKTKLTLDVVLEEVPQEELLSFIKEYARHHRQFSLSLKARFTPQVDHIQSRDKYAQLLNTAISVARKADRRISLRGVQKLIKVLEEILFQAEGYLYAAHYAEVIDAAGILLEKITPILNKVDRGREQLDVYLRQAFALLGRVAAADAPPALKRRLWEYALSESNKLFYRNQSLDVDFFHLLFRLAGDVEKQKQLLQLLEEHLEVKVTQPEAEEELLLLKLKILEQTGSREQIDRFFQQHLGRQRLLKRAVSRARKMEDWDAARHWISSALELSESAETRQEWQKLALEVALESGEKRDILPLAMDLFVDSGQASYFDLALAQAEDSTKVSDEALQRLVLQSARPIRQEAIATVLLRTGRREELLTFLEHAQSLVLLQKFDQPWHKKDQEQVFPLYRSLLMDYLKDHLGRVTSQKIKNVIEFLYQTGRSSLAERLVEEMKNTYPERHSLMEELDIV